MKATLEFNLPEETNEHQSAVDGGKWKSVVWELDEWLRTTIKHTENPPSLIVIREQIREIINDHGLVLE